VPDRGELRSGALALTRRSRLAPLELGFVARLLLRGLTLRLDPRLAAGRGSLTPRLGARRRRVDTPPLFRCRAALRLRRTCGLLGAVAPLGTVGLVPLGGLVRPVATIGLFGRTAVAAVVVPLVF
jgi:hypothetical protein